MECLDRLSAELGQLLLERQLVLATAESCTGGGVAMAVTETAGSSAWFDRAFVTYSNEAKMEMLAVNADVLATHGAVSEAIVVEMAHGALRCSKATTTVAISGVAGPGGGSQEKPVGMVCFAWVDSLGWSYTMTQHFDGDRSQVRQKAVYCALEVLRDHYLLNQDQTT